MPAGLDIVKASECPAGAVFSLGVRFTNFITSFVAPVLTRILPFGDESILPKNGTTNTTCEKLCPDRKIDRLTGLGHRRNTRQLMLCCLLWVVWVRSGSLTR